MSLQPLDFPIDTVPEDTRRVAEAAFPRGNDYLVLRQKLGSLFLDSDFADICVPTAGSWLTRQGALRW